MKVSAVQGALLIVHFLVVQNTAVDYISSNWTYNCNYEPCILTLWFAEQLLESFRNCLCSALTASCIVHYSQYPRYTDPYTQRRYEGYFGVTRILPSYIYNDPRGALPKFTCTLVPNTYLQCNRNWTRSEGEFRNIQLYTDARDCSFKCVYIIKSTTYGISFDYNNILNNVYLPTTCSSSSESFTSVSTTATTTTQQATTREEPPTTTPNTTTPLIYTVTTKTALPDVNLPLTNKSELEDSRHNKRDDGTDMMLISGIITPIVSVIVIAVVILLLRRRRINTLSERKSKCKIPSKENDVPASNSRSETFPENNVQSITQSNKEINGSNFEVGSPLQDINNESTVEYSTVKKKSERQINLVSPPRKQGVDTNHQLNNINSLTSNDYTEVDISPQYCYVTCDTSHIPHTSGESDIPINQETESERVYANAEKSPHDHVESNYTNVTRSYQLDHPTTVDNMGSGNDSSASSANGPVHTTTDVYAKLGGQSRDMTNPYDILSDKSDRAASACAGQNAS